jgi:antitoxin HigA-1
MIAGFRDEWLRAFFVDDIQSKNVPPDLERLLFRKLQMLDDATTDQDLRVPPSNHFEKLRGDLAGFHSIRVNKQCLSRRPLLPMRGTMLMTKRKPATVGEILVEEFMRPMGLTQSALAEAMGVQRKHVNELCNDRRAVTAPTALILARVFGNSADFWLNVQRRTDLWEALNSPRERERIERAKPLQSAA